MKDWHEEWWKRATSSANRRMAEEVDKKFTTPDEPQTLAKPFRVGKGPLSWPVIGVDIGTGKDYSAVVLSQVVDGKITVLGTAVGRGPAFLLTLRAFLDAVYRRMKNVKIFGDER